MLLVIDSKEWSTRDEKELQLLIRWSRKVYWDETDIQMKYSSLSDTLHPFLDYRLTHSQRLWLLSLFLSLYFSALHSGGKKDCKRKPYSRHGLPILQCPSSLSFPQTWFMKEKHDQRWDKKQRVQENLYKSFLRDDSSWVIIIIRKKGNEECSGSKDCHPFFWLFHFLLTAVMKASAMFPVNTPFHYFLEASLVWNRMLFWWPFGQSVSLVSSETSLAQLKVTLVFVYK